MSRNFLGREISLKKAGYLALGVDGSKGTHDSEMCCVQNRKKLKTRVKTLNTDKICVKINEYR